MRSALSSLDFPGAIFVGIHDDECEDGLAASVRKNMPEDSVIIDLDSGDIDCSSDRYVGMYSSLVDDFVASALATLPTLTNTLFGSHLTTSDMRS